LCWCSAGAGAGAGAGAADVQVDGCCCVSSLSRPPSARPAPSPRGRSGTTCVCLLFAAAARQWGSGRLAPPILPVCLAGRRCDSPLGRVGLYHDTLLPVAPALCPLPSAVPSCLDSAPSASLGTARRAARALALVAMRLDCLSPVSPRSFTPVHYAILHLLHPSAANAI
jgi:hypothetical protein